MSIIVPPNFRPVDDDGKATLDFATLFRRVVEAVNAVSFRGTVRAKAYLKSQLPSAAEATAGAIVYVSDEAGGAVLAFSDGAAWRRVTDRVVVS